MFYSTDDFVLNCLDPRYPPPQTNHTGQLTRYYSFQDQYHCLIGLGAVDVEWSHLPEALNLSTSTYRQVYGSFVLPKKLIGVARNEGLPKCS